MVDRIKFYIWYLFFSAYWSAHNWGAIKPESNASGLLGVIILLIFSAIFQTFLYLGFQMSDLLFVILVVVPTLILPYLLFRRNKRYGRKMIQFEFLKSKSYSKKRIIIVASTFVFALILNTGVAILRNLGDTF